MEQFTKPVEGQFDGQEMTVTHPPVSSGLLEKLEGGTTNGQLSSEHEIHPDLIQIWKIQRPKDGSRVFMNHERPHQKSPQSYTG